MSKSQRTPEWVAGYREGSSGGDFGRMPAGLTKNQKVCWKAGNREGMRRFLVNKYSKIRVNDGQEAT